MTRNRLFPLLCALSAALSLSSCTTSKVESASSKGPAARPGVPVTVATVRQENVPIEIAAIGNVEAYNTVGIKSQVNGQVMRVFFKEGQDVKKGDMLFQIDPRAFEEQVHQAEAQLAKDTAQISQAQANLARDTAQSKLSETQAARYAKLSQEGVISREQYDQVRTTSEAAHEALQADRAAIESAHAAVRADEAAIANAKLQVEYAQIRAPISGRTGALVIQEGNLVKANEAPALVTINQITPIYVSFSAPEKELPPIKTQMAAGRLPVRAAFKEETKEQQETTQPEEAEGALTFVDNTVDRATGSIRLKATFANTARRLWPGQFVNVTLRLGEQTGAVLAPSQAVQNGQNGQYVFVVKTDRSAEMRSVATTRSYKGQAIIDKGLQPGETVVTDGQVRLTPGVKVEIVKSGA